MQQVLFNLPAGDWASGERGIACHPGREDEFVQGVKVALQLAKKLAVPRLNCLSGLMPKGVSDRQCRGAFLSNLRRAADAAAEVGVELMIEPINSRIDMPGFWLDTPALAMSLIDELRHPNLFLQFDCYHAHVMGSDVPSQLHLLLPRIRHLQIADHPGRHQPGSGEMPYPAIFDALMVSSYTGWVGCEYRPTGEVQNSLSWARRWLDPVSAPKEIG